MAPFLLALLACSGLGSGFTLAGYPAGAPYPPEAIQVHAPMVATVPVAAPRELRGLWVATVANLDFPSKPGLSADTMRAELDRLVDTARDTGFNALVFQVRPEGDALYDSLHEPWSRYLTGTQGEAPALDPLQYLIERAHGEGIEVHAWFNPYRAALSSKPLRHPQHISNTAKDHTHRWGHLLWLDPGVLEVQDHAVAVVDDVVTRYDVDGVHLDDYFYPYPDGTKRFPDQASFSAYQETGGLLKLDAWRRDNVDTLVHRLAHTVRARRPHVRFGISPFGIYRPGQPEGIRGMDQVTALHADPMSWYDQGFVDYLAPQLYWPTTKEAQRYDRLLEWWNEHSEPDRPLVVGLDFTKVGRPAWSLDEIRTQIDLARHAGRTAGWIGFRAKPVLDNQAGLADLLTELQGAPALLPPIARLEREVAPPELAVDGENAAVSWEPRKALVVYREVDGQWKVEQILPRDTTDLALGPGRWAVSQVDEGGWESRGVLVDTDAAALAD